MTSVLMIGGSRFIGRHTTMEFLKHDYDVTLFNRGNHEDPFADHERADHITGDRTNRAELEDAARAVEPDFVVDCVGMKPAEVEDAVDIFDSGERYVYVSSIGVYEEEPIMKYEEGTPLIPCSPEQAVDDSFASYNARKAEGDRVALGAADNGVDAVSVRPTMVYGPYDYLGNLEYWIDRVLNHDRILVPGDGNFACHRSYVKDVASAIRIAAEEGEQGEGYNVGDRQPLTLRQTIQLIADVADRDVDLVYAGDRELNTGDLERTDFPIYLKDVPFLLSTEKIARLGWQSTPLEEAHRKTIEYHNNTEEANDRMWPAREQEEKVLAELP